MLVNENEVIGQKILLLLNKTVIFFFLVKNTFCVVRAFTVICFLCPPEIATEKVKQYHTDFFVSSCIRFFFFLIEISMTVM